MHIRRIVGENFRGHDFSTAVGPVTVVTGKNFAGKTTLTDAARLALAGYLPEVGKVTGGIWAKLAGQPDEPGTMRVVAEFDDELKSCLTWTKTKAGKVSSDGVVPPQVALPGVLIDPRSFFGLTAQARSQAVLDASGEVNLKVETVTEKLWAIEASPAKVRDAEVRVLCSEVTDAFSKHGLEAVAKLSDAWKDRLKTAKVEHKVASGAFAGMTLPREMPRPAAGLDELREELAKAQAARGEMKALLQAQTQQATANGRLVKFEQELKTAEDVLAALGDPGPEPPEPKLMAEHRTAYAKFRESESEVDQAWKESTRLQTERQKMEGLTICPVCGSQAELDLARKRLDERIAQAMAAETKAVAAQAEILAPFEDIGQVEAEWDIAKQEHADAVRQVQAMTVQVTSLKALVAQARRAMAEGDQTAKIEALKPTLDGIEALQAKLQALEDKDSAYRAYQDLLSRREKKEVEVLTLGCQVEVLGEAIKRLSEEASKASEASFGKVLKLADAFTQGILNSPLEFREGELGRRASKADTHVPVGSWIPHESFSGTEQLLAYAGFAVALARQSKFKLVVLDEMGNVAPELRAKVVKRMLELVKAGTIDQVFMIDPSPVEGLYEAKGLTRVEV